MKSRRKKMTRERALRLLDKISEFFLNQELEGKIKRESFTLHSQEEILSIHQIYGPYYTIMPCIEDKERSNEQKTTLDEMLEERNPKKEGVK